MQRQALIGVGLHVNLRRAGKFQRVIRQVDQHPAQGVGAGVDDGAGLGIKLESLEKLVKLLNIMQGQDHCMEQLPHASGVMTKVPVRLEVFDLSG